MPPSIFISAGEASGEHYGALVISAIQQRLKTSAQAASFFGMGGERMAAAGLECIVRSEEMAVMGLTEVVRHLPRIWREFRKLKKSIRARQPSMAILIDFPEIHFRLAKELHRLGVPVLYFVSPQLWAWKKHRIKLVRKYIDRMLVIFPFEEPFYRNQGVQAEFVGHPLAELPPPAVSRAQFAAENGLDPAKTWIGLLPGSRPREIRVLLPTILRAAQILAERSAEHATASLEFVIPLAPTLNAEQRDEVRRLVETHGSGLPVRLVNEARATLHHARASIVASGTATVEAALAGNPFVVVYRVSPLTYAIARRVVTVPHVAMANLIAGKRVVPELIQSDFTPENIVHEIEPLLHDGPPRQSMMEELAQIRELLTRGLLKTSPAGGASVAGGAGETGNAIDCVASVALDLMKIKSR
ncbi:MAG TPA: lipid-A-disaccharide synthase [Terracidiphilus sp.]|jgi:lipid-A-disaccharide synthase